MRVSCEHKDKIIELRKSGVQFQEISEQTGISYNTIKSICYRNGAYRQNVVSMKKQMETDRLTMTTKEVAAKYNRTIRAVNQATQDSQLKDKFKFPAGKKPKPPKIKKEKVISEKPKRKLKKIDKQPAGVKEDLLQKMNKGEIKLLKGETVFKTKVHDVTKQRQISLRDPKNTVIFVKMSDTRSDEEIRNQFLNR